MPKFKKNYKIILLSEIFWSFSMGILGPVYAIFVKGVGNGTFIDVGVAYAILLITVSLLSVPFGHLSDKIGKKRIALAGALLYLPIPFLYPNITSIYQIFILQIWDGISSAMVEPAWQAMLATSTKKGKRGIQYGFKDFLNTFSGAIAAIVGGIITELFGFTYTFYFIGFLSILATITILFIKDDARSRRKHVKISFGRPIFSWPK